MADTVSIAEAKNTLPKLIHEVETGSAITLTRRGKPVAVLISCAEIEHLKDRRPLFSNAFAAFLNRFDLEELLIDPDEVFVRARDLDSRRDVVWE